MVPKRKYQSCQQKCYNGIMIHYRDFPGMSGKTVVFLSGLTANSAAFYGIIDALGEEYRCIAVDFRGRGLSEHAPEGQYGVQTHAKDIMMLLDQIKVGSVTLVAHSFGAYVATVVAAERPDLVKSMVLMEGGKAGISMEDLKKSCEAGLQRTKMVFPSMDACVEFWHKTAPYMDEKAWTPYFDEYIASDVKTNEDGTVQCRAMGEAISEDTLKGYTEYNPADYAPKLKADVTMAWASAPLIGDKPMYSEEALREFCDMVGENATFMEVKGTNHLDIIYTPAYLEQIAAVVREKA